MIHRHRMFILGIWLILTAAGDVHSQGRGFGLGVILGEPTGFSMKGWIDPDAAIDAGLAWSFLHESTFHVHVDYLRHAFHAVTDSGNAPAYYGIGGRIKTGGAGDDRVGVRIVGGLDYFIPKTTIDLFGEIAPILDVAPSTRLEINVGIGARYFFK